MRRIKEVLRLKYDLGLGQRQIARSCSIGQATVNDYLRRAEAAGLRWPLTEEWDDDRIDRELFWSRTRPSTSPLQRIPPDFPSIHDQLRQHQHLTLQLLWVEYRQAHLDGYGYSHLCAIIRSGGASSMPYSGRSTRRARNSSSIEPVPRFPSTSAPPVWSGRQRCSSLSWGPVPIRMPRRLAISRWNRGFRRMSTLLSFTAVCHHSLFPITPGRASHEPA